MCHLKPCQQQPNTPRPIRDQRREHGGEGSVWPDLMCIKVKLKSVPLTFVQRNVNYNDTAATGIVYLFYNFRLRHISKS